MRVTLALLLLSIPSASIAQAGSYKLIITWYQAGMVVVDYPSAARCEAARRAVEAEVAKRQRETVANLPPGGIIFGTSANGAFCIPG